MSIETYKFIHIATIILVFTSMGSLVAQAHLGETQKKSPIYKLNMLVHGIGLLLLLVSGFGLLHKMGIPTVSTWAVVKLAIWLTLGLSPLIVRKVSVAKVNFAFLSLLTLIAVYFGVFKPFI